MDEINKRIDDFIKRTNQKKRDLLCISKISTKYMLMNCKSNHISLIGCNLVMLLIIY